RSFEITTTERRVMCLILAKPPPGGDARTARAAVARHQGELEILQDGMWFVPMTSAGTATDLAARAARCALGVRELVPGAPISIVAGRGVASRLPVGEMIDRAVRLLDPEGGAIVVDDVMGGLLALRFELTARAAGGQVLCGERD